MKRLLLGVFLTAGLLISCSNDSSSGGAAAPGKDGVKEMGSENLKYKNANDPETIDNINIGSMEWEMGKDLTLVMGYHFGKDLQGTVKLEESDLTKYIKDKLPDGTCFLSDVEHQWLVSRQGDDTEVFNKQNVEFRDKSVLYLTVHTRSAPKCVKVIFGFTTTTIDVDAVPAPPPPEPTPIPTPTPTPTFPAGSESVVVISSSNPDYFSIHYEKNGTSNFKYNVKMTVNGPKFAENHPVEKIFVAVYDKTFLNYASPWTEIVTMQTPFAALPPEFAMNFTLDQFSAPTFLIDRQKDLSLVFAINSPDHSPTAFRSLELSKYCSFYTHSFVEVETGYKGCN